MFSFLTQSTSTVSRGLSEQFFKEKNGLIYRHNIKNGFSWTVFLFGIIALAIRRQWDLFLLLLLLELIFNRVLLQSFPISLFYSFYTKIDLSENFATEPVL